MALKTVQAIIGGVTTTLTYNSSSGKYEATVTAPSKSSFNQSGGYYNVTIKATDTAGNVTTKDGTDSTLGASLKLYVKEKVAPVLSFLNPTSGAYIITNKPTIRFKVTCDDEVCNDFIIYTAKAELINKSLTKEVGVNIAESGKEIGILIDSTELPQGNYQLIITYSINDEILKKRLDVRIT